MSKAFYQYQDLREKHGLKGLFGGTDAERTAQCIREAGLSLVVLATFAHRTKLEADGAVKVHFAESFSVDLKEETTADALLQDLAGQLISFSKDRNGKKWGQARGISGCSGLCLDNDAEQDALKGFLADPMSAVPDELRDEVTQGLAKKAKSINKRVRNYDNETARRARGRKSRAITSLTKVLADLDPEFREMIVKAIRLNRTTTGQYGITEHSLNKLHTALNVVLSSSNLENWQDEDVIPEAERLASVAWVMNQ